ncbi:MAG: tetratricopeptide repeat protein [Anaerolineae bacterium]|nr:tetratricopeptide repeat protein [Anaerolineae bacterium]
MSRQADIQKLIITHRRHLQKLQEIQAYKGSSTEPHILLEIEDTTAEIEKLEAELKNIKDSSPATPTTRYGSIRKVFQNHTRKIGLGFGAIIGVGIIVWGIGAFFDQSKELPPRPICQTSPVPVQIVVAQLPNCPSDFQAQLVEQWTGETAAVLPLNQVFATGSATRAQTGADIVVWGACNQQNPAELTLTYELITSRKPDEIYEPTRLSITGPFTDLANLGLALISYQHGDYAQAVDQFSALPAIKTTAEPALVWANSLLFAGRYEAAIDAYEEIILTLKPDWSVIYNNLGIARFNKELLEAEGTAQAGRDHFEQAIKLAEAQGETDLALLAHVNNSRLLLQGRKWDTAKKHCEMALSLNTQSALPYICRATFHFFQGFSAAEKMDLKAIKQDLEQAAQFDDAPAKLYYLRAIWYEQEQQKQAAIENYLRFFNKMEYRACLHTDQEALHNAAIFLDELSR